MVLCEYTPNLDEIMGESDSISIQRAIDEASASGVNVVRIPKFNERTGKDIWEITEALLLPSDIHIILDRCHLRMADGVMCQMFRNKNAFTELGRKAEGEQKNICITGIGDAVLDGGIPNGLSEYTSNKNGMPHVSQNLTIFMHHVTGFKIEGIKILNQRWWSMAFLHCKNGRITDVKFQLTRRDEDYRLPWRNQDGINLREGCSNIEIDHISGETGDDLIAMTALKGFEKEHTVEGRQGDIHDINIHDICGVTNTSSMIRMLCHYGNRIYRINARNIFDASVKDETARHAFIFWIGEDGYYKKEEERARYDSISDITIENVYSRAMTAVTIEIGVKNLYMKNIHVADDGGYLFNAGPFLSKPPYGVLYHPESKEMLDAKYSSPILKETFTLIKNAVISDLYFDGNDPSDAVFGLNNARFENVKISNVFNNTSKPMFAFFQMDEQEIEID